jgi:hypothetical protein
MKNPMLVLLMMAAAAPAHAQLDYYGRLGITGSTALVRDIIFEPFETKPAVAPTLVLGASLPLGRDNRFGIEGTIVSGSLSASPESGGESIDLGRLTTLSAMANVGGVIHGPFHWLAGLGLVKYVPADKDGLFAQGGPLRYFVGIGIDFRHPVSQSWDLMAAGRYDFHRFTTEELRDRGFTQTQGVQRASLTLGLARNLP